MTRNDSCTSGPTPDQVEAAAKAIWERSAKIDDPFWDGGALGYGIKQIYRADARAALVAAQEAAPARPVIDREAVAHEVYRELYPGTIGTHDSKRTPESDLAEADRAYLTWDSGNEGFAPGVICRRVADRVIAHLGADMGGQE